MSLRPLALAVLTAAAALAADLPAAGPRVVRALSLTGDQQAALRALRERRQPDLAALRTTLRQKREAFRSALHQDGADAAKLRSLYDQAAAARFDLMLARRAFRQEALALLTPAQRERAAELRGLAKARFRSRMRHRRDGMFPG